MTDERKTDETEWRSDSMQPDRRDARVGGCLGFFLIRATRPLHVLSPRLSAVWIPHRSLEGDTRAD